MMNCKVQKKTKKFDKITYKAQTRGSMLQFTVIGNSLSYKTYQKQEAKEVAKEQLEEIGNLKVPSEKG